MGKSTLLAKLLCGLEGGAGFCTVVLRGGVPPRRSVHLLDATRKEVPCQRNRLFFCGEGMDEAAVERFCRLGCAALAQHGHASYLIMDELGPHEERAVAFQRCVLQALEGDTPVFGVLQRAQSAFLERVRAHPRVHVACVARENRNALVWELLPFRRQVDGTVHGLLALRQAPQGPLALLVRDGAQWRLPQGRAEPGETGEQAAVRSAREQAGIAAAAEGLLLADGVRPEGCGGVAYYAGTVIEGEAALRPACGSLARWMPLAEAHARLGEIDRSALEVLMRRG